MLDWSDLSRFCSAATCCISVARLAGSVLMAGEPAGEGAGAAVRGPAPVTGEEVGSRVPGSAGEATAAVVGDAAGMRGGGGIGCFGSAFGPGGGIGRMADASETAGGRGEKETSGECCGATNRCGLGMVGGEAAGVGWYFGS